MQRSKIWFDNLSTPNFFLRYRPDLLQYFSVVNPSHPQLKDQLIKNAIRDFIPPPSQTKVPHEFQIQKVIPRLKDRGVLVEFSFDSAKQNALDDILTTIRKHLHTNTPEAMARADKSHWFMGADQIRAFLVKGEPFMEDIISRTASNRLKVEFHGADPSIESLYASLRPFGRISDITYVPNKEGLRYALVFFSSMRGSSSAKTCMNGAVIDGTKIHIQYVPFIRTNALKKWAADHPRVSAPLAITALVALSYTVFDPVRVFCIHNEITSRFSFALPTFLSAYVGGARDNLSRWIPETWFKKNTQLLVDPSTDFAGRIEVKTKLESWLEEKPNSVMLVVGPKGYGKTRLVKSITDKKKNKLCIRCDLIVNNSEHDMLPRLASQVGYFPILSFASLTKIADTLITATTGQKAGFSTSTESEIRKVLQLTTVALSRVVSEQKKHQEVLKPLSSAPNENEDELPESSDIEYPVVVITNFMDIDHQQFGNENQVNNERLYETIAEWAAFLAQNEIAHVVFVSSGGQHAVGSGTSGGRLNKLLTKALPNRALEYLVFSDASKEDALTYLRQRLIQVKANDDAADSVFDKTIAVQKSSLDHVVEHIGGRLSDLEAFVGKVRAGMSFEDALDDLVSKAQMELRRYGLGEQQFNINSDDMPRWSATQFWFLLKELVKHDGEVNFETIKHSAIFKGDETAIHNMERADMISITYESGRPASLKPSKPLHFAAMKQMAGQGPPTSSLDFKLAKELWEQENKKAREYEEELKGLILTLQAAGLGIPKTLSGSSGWFWGDQQGSPSEVHSHPLIARYDYIATLLKQSQMKVEKYAWEVEHCKSQFK